VPLTGLSTASATPVAATDTVLTAPGKLQAQCSVNAQALQNYGRNKLLNPRFAIQQRGAGPWTTSGLFTADRWKTLTVTDGYTASLVALTDADRAAIGDENATAAMQFVIAGSVSGFSQFCQSMENVRVLSGKTVTLSFWLKASTALSVGAYFYQYFGSGGAPSAAVAVAPATFALSTGWARYSVSVALPSTAGKTLGTNNDHSTGLYFGLSAEAAAAAQCGVGVQSGTFTLWGVQVEIGAVASPLEARPVDVELALCQRFYQIFPAVFVGGYGGNNGTIYQQLPLSVPMRAVPALTLSGQSYSNAGSLAAQAVRATDIVLQATVTAILGGTATASAAATLSADL
jgi:hypothetical protein